MLKNRPATFQRQLTPYQLRLLEQKSKRPGSRFAQTYTLIALLISAASTVLTVYGLKEARVANAQASKNAQIELTAYLEAHPIGVGDNKIRFQVTNNGMTPALLVTAHIYATYYDPKGGYQGFNGPPQTITFGTLAKDGTTTVDVPISDYVNVQKRALPGGQVFFSGRFLATNVFGERTATNVEGWTTTADLFGKLKSDKFVNAEWGYNPSNGADWGIFDR